MKHAIFLLTALLMITVPNTSAAYGDLVFSIIFVDDSAAGDNNGNDWINAYVNLQSALDIARENDHVEEIRVAQGIYRPTGPNGDRDISIELIDGVSIIGGYAGFGAVEPDERNVDAYETILSGDLNGNDVEVTNPVYLDEPSRDENSYHVVKSVDRYETMAVLDGFVITGGNPDGDDSPATGGGAVYIDRISEPVFRNCSIVGNLRGGMSIYQGGANLSNCSFIRNNGPGIDNGYSSHLGGDILLENCYFIENETWGIRNSEATALISSCSFLNNGSSGIYNDESKATITDCIFNNNICGIKNYDSIVQISDCIFRNNFSSGVSNLWSSPSIYKCQFIYNTAERGGAIHNDVRSRPIITHCKFLGNSAQYGGAMYSVVGDYYTSQYNISGGPDLSNCIFVGNTAMERGGAICNIDPDNWRSMASIVLENCTLVENHAPNVGGIYAVTEMGDTLVNCILWGNNGLESNERDQFYWYYYNGSSRSDYIKYCCIQDGDPNDGVVPFSTTNIDNDPLFARYPSDGGDGWGDEPTTPEIDESANDDFGDLHLLGISPCVDTGKPEFYPSVYSDYTDFDLDGLPRLSGQRINMGAYEYSVIVTEPKPAEILIAGDIYEIRWEGFTLSGTVTISYSTNRGDDWITVNDSTPDTGTYTWIVPNGIDSDQCVIAVLNGPPNPDIYRWAQRVTIKPRMINPDDGEVWVTGSIHPVQWHVYDPNGMVDIQFSKDGGNSWNMIATGVGDTGSHTWHLPDIVDSAECLISVVPSGSSMNIESVQSDIFTVHPSIPDVSIETAWPTLGGSNMRTGLSENAGPELGCIKWQFPTGSAIHQSVAIGADNNVHIPTEGGTLYTLTPSGNILWTYQADSEITSSPTVGSDGTVYIGTRNGKLYAIDKNGSVRWTHSTEAMIYSSPAVDDQGRIFIASANGNIYALAPDGSELWSFTTKDISPLTRTLFASPTIGLDGTVYIASLYDNNFYALNPADGSEKWIAPLPAENGLFASPVVARDGTIYIIPLYSTLLYAIDPSDGTLIQQTDLAPSDSNWLPVDYADNYPGAQCLTEPVIGLDGTIYVSLDDPYLRAVNPDGTIKWATRLGMVGGFTLTIADNGLIYAACDDGTLYVVDVDGNELSRFTGSKWLSFPVIAPDGTIYISDSDNTLWAINSAPCDSSTDLHRPEDISADGIVNLADFSLFAANWLDCTEPGTDNGCDCNGVEIQYYPGDIDHNLYVNLNDLMQIADKWLNSN